MLAHLVVRLNNDNSFTTWFNHNDDHFELLSGVIEAYHLFMLQVEFELLELDIDRKSKQQMFVFYNEVTNLVTKIDILNCLQMLTVRDQKTPDEKERVLKRTSSIPLSPLNRVKRRKFDSP